MKTYETEETINLVFEYFDGGDLYMRIAKNGPLSSKLALCVMEELLQGISYLHSQKIIHRDIKPHNIFMQYFL